MQVLEMVNLITLNSQPIKPQERVYGVPRKEQPSQVIIY